MNWVTRSLEIGWGIFAWISFGLAVMFSLIVVIIVPGAARRQKLVTFAARMVFVLPRVKVTVIGMDHLPTDNCVVVANHASYLDGVLLKGFLPWRFNFVIKGEMRDFGPAHFLLRRSGSKFVERSDIRGSTRDARQIVAAIKGQMPVVPVAIIGSRHMLPARRLLPRPGPLTIMILPAIAPGDAEYDDSRLLAETARQRILGVLDEPDLVASETPASN